MHFVDQSWKQVDLSVAPERPRVESLHAQPRESSFKLSSAADGPSLQAFTPRVRVLIQCARVKYKMKLSELSARTHIPVKHLKAIEEGDRLPSAKMLDVLQEVLHAQLKPESQPI